MSRALLILLLVGCTVPAQTPNRWQTGGDEDGVRLRLRGRIDVDVDDGRVIFHLAEDACIDSRRESVPCGPIPPGGLQDTFLRTPWGARALATSGGPGWIGFWVNWGNTGVDALDEKSAQDLGAPWYFESQYADSPEPEVWRPGPADIDTMRHLVGKATQTEYEIAATDVPPRLQVADFHVERELRSGETTRLSLRVKNGGAGPAYRVRVRTRSNVPALHGLSFFFGALPPGASKTRQVDASIPTGNPEAEGVVVLLFEEGNGHVPPTADARFPIRPALAPPTLELTCQVRGQPGTPSVSAGQPLDVDCQVKNVGAAVDGVHLAAAVTGGGRDRESERFSLGVDETRAVSVSVEVPRELPLSGTLELVVEARDLLQAARPARVVLPLALARQRICQVGQLSRAAYDEKLQNLRKALAEGAISQDEFRAYETELVSCLE